MSTEIKSTKTYWLAFALSLIACIGFLIVLPEWFWVTLPFLFTSYVYAMRWV